MVSSERVKLVLANGEKFEGWYSAGYTFSRVCRECGQHVYHEQGCPFLAEEFRAVMSWHT